MNINGAVTVKLFGPLRKVIISIFHVLFLPFTVFKLRTLCKHVIDCSTLQLAVHRPARPHSKSKCESLHDCFTMQRSLN